MMKQRSNTPPVWPIVALVTALAVLGLTGCPSTSVNGTEDGYALTFNPAGGAPTPDAQSVPDGGTAAAPSPVPVREGYLLEGWYTEADYLNRWDFAVDTVEEDITLYAKWSPVDAGSWAVSFDAAGGSPAPEAQVVANNGRAGAPSPVPVREGYLLEGWYTEAEHTSRWNFTSSRVTANITLYARWSPVAAGKVVVSFDAQGGSPAPAAQAADSGAKLTRPANPAKADHTFEGWFVSLEDGAAWNFSVDTAAESLTLYAKWKLKEYVVAFNANGGSAVESQTVPHGGKAVEPEPPVKGSLFLDGWHKESSLATKWDFALDTVTANTTLYAKWLEIPPGFHRVAFNSRGSGAVESQIIENNGKVTEPEAPTRNNYVFDGWHKEAACVNGWDFAVDSITANTTLYAKWVPVWTVTFDARQGGAVDPVTGVRDGALIAKPAADPVREGYSFAGWHKEAACVNVWDFAADTITANTTIYAKWTPVYAVAFDSQGGGAVASIEDVLSGALIAKPSDPSLAGCAFAGWFKEAAGTNAWDFAADTVTADTTLYAQWTATVSFNAGGGSPVPASQNLRRGGLAARPAEDPVLAGKTFAGWFKEAAGTTAWNFASDAVTADTTIYAKWDFIPVAEISNGPKDGIIGEALDLSGVVVEPPDASLTTIVWSVKSAGTTGVTAANSFTPSAIGTLVLTATVSGGGASGNYVQDFTIPITRIRKVTGISGIVSQPGLEQGALVDLNKAAATPANATNKTIVWSIKTPGAGVSSLPDDKKLVLTAGGTLVLTATIANGDEDAAGVLSAYTQDFSFTVDKTSAPGGVGFGDPAAIKLYANGDTEPLSADEPIPVPLGGEYYLSVDGACSNVEWFLDGNLSSVSGGTLYLDTARAGTVVVTVTADLGGAREDSVYTFVIE